MLLADSLSRAALPETGELVEDLEQVVHAQVNKVCMSKDNYDSHVKALKNDEDKWPSYNQLDNLSQSFYKYREQVHYENDLLFKDHKLLIPKKLQLTICKWLHAPHLGIEKTLSRARAQFF